MKTIASQVALTFMIFTAAWVNARTDTTANAAPLSGSPSGETKRSGSLALFAGFQQGIQTVQEQKTQDIGWLVGTGVNIRLADAWELSPEFSLWRMSVYQKQQWNFRVGLPIRWFPLAGGRVSAYALTGFGFLFAGGLWPTVDVGAGTCFMVSDWVTLTGEMRTFLYYHTSDIHSSMVLVSPISLVFGFRLTPSK